MLNIPQQLAGCKLFPVQVGDKLPAIDGWQNRATDDAAQVAAWDGSMPNLNWGVNCGASGLFVIDIDPAGMVAWRELQDKNPELREAVAKSFTVRTPRGGFHHYFRGYGPTSASAIAPGIDTRGGYPDPETGRFKSSGFVVAPGSKTVAGPKTVDGEYTVVGGEILPMSPAVQAIVPERKKGSVIGLQRNPDQDQPRNVQWARDLLQNYVKEGRVSIEGSGGDNTAFQVAASILDKAISPAMTFELMDELWNPHCSPPWDDWDLERVVGNAAKYGEETGTGAKGFEDNASAFAHFIGMETPEEPKHAEKRRDRVQWIDDFAANVQDPVWLLPGILPAQGTGMMFGASGSYKSFLALDMASCLAHGHPGQWGAPPVMNDVLYFAGEAPIGTARQRRPAWLEWQDVATPHRLAVFPRVPYLGDKDGWEGVKQDIAEMGMTPKLIVIDTLTRLLTGFDENSTKDATVATGFLEDLSRYYECFVLAIHHTGKDEGKGARGSSAFFANMDTVLSTKKRGTDGTELRVKKHKDADAPETSIALKVRKFGKSIVLEKNGEGTDEPDKPLTDSKKSWSSGPELVARISKQGGRVNFRYLVEDIFAELHIDKKKIENELRARGDIQWLREGDYFRIPSQEQEFDL